MHVYKYITSGECEQYRMYDAAATKALLLRDIIKLDGNKTS